MRLNKKHNQSCFMSLGTSPERCKWISWDAVVGYATASRKVGYVTAHTGSLIKQHELFEVICGMMQKTYDRIFAFFQGINDACKIVYHLDRMVA
jgi:hypothetical protein